CAGQVSTHFELSGHAHRRQCATTVSVRDRADDLGSSSLRRNYGRDGICTTVGLVDQLDLVAVGWHVCGHRILHLAHVKSAMTASSCLSGIPCILPAHTRRGIVCCLE